MPKPKAGESQSEYISRCIPIVMDEGKTQDQAAGQCHGMWDTYKKEKARTVGGFESPEPGRLPEKGKQLLANTYSKYRKQGMNKEDAAKRAWGAVRAAGYKKEKSEMKKEMLLNKIEKAKKVMIDGITDDTKVKKKKPKKKKKENKKDEMKYFVDEMKPYEEKGKKPKSYKLTKLKKKKYDLLARNYNENLKKGLSKGESSKKALETLYNPNILFKDVDLEKQDKRPPKKWWDDCVASVGKNPEVDDPQALCGWLWYHGKKK